MVMYKRRFFHFANIYQPRKVKREELSFCKDYEAICQEWLGGLSPRRHKSAILRDQLGRHIDGLKRSGLIRRCDIERKADGEGFKITFYPGRGFFADYEAYYLDRQQPRLRFKQTADLVDIQQPIKLVSHFHELLGHEHHTYDEKETAYAAQLLKAHSMHEVRDLIAYTIERGRETNFRMRWFGAISKYRGEWLADRKRQDAAKQRQAAITACPHCDESGMMIVKNRTGAFGARVCPHEIEAITELEDAENLRRV